MKKLFISCAVFALTITSCEDECMQDARVINFDKVSFQQSKSGNTSLTEDTLFEGNTVFNGGLNLNGFTATVTGEVQVNGNLNGPGELKYCEVLEVTGRIQNDPKLTNDCTTLSNGEISVSVGDIVDVPCNYDFDNQKVKIDQTTGLRYKYERVDN